MQSYEDSLDQLILGLNSKKDAIFKTIQLAKIEDHSDSISDK